MQLIELPAFLQHTAANAGLWLYTQHGISHYLRTHYGNDPVNNPFRYLYQWNAFDTTLLIPYFVVMIILAFYGMHRYQLVYLYYKHRETAPSSTRPAISPNCPASRCSCLSSTSNSSSTVSLTPAAVWNIRRTDSRSRYSMTRPTRPTGCRAHGGALSRARPPIVYMHRTNRYGYKAGALDAGLKAARRRISSPSSTRISFRRPTG